MIPAIGMLIAIYGTARLLNDGLNRFGGNATIVGKIATALTIMVGGVGICGLWWVMVNMVSAGINTPSMSP